MTKLTYAQPHSEFWSPPAKENHTIGHGHFGKMSHFLNYIAYIILNMTYGLRLGNGLNQ